LSAKVISLTILALAASLLLARVHPFGDAGLFSASNSAPLSTFIPAPVRTILAADCADCHAAPAHTPIYGHFAPASWLLERDITQARRHLNLSTWDAYTADQQQAFASKMLLEARSHDMPPIQYRLAHWHTSLNPQQIQAVAAWANATGVSDSTPSQTLLSGDAVRGKTVFQKRCTGCHALEQNREGPRLGGVYGRTSGTAPAFNYSSAVKQAHIVWNDTTLEKWLADPDAFVPGNNMDFHLPNPQERRDLIAFLKESSGS
jgi:cytochrome c